MIASCGDLVPQALRDKYGLSHSMVDAQPDPGYKLCVWDNQTGGPTHKQIGITMHCHPGDPSAKFAARKEQQIKNAEMMNMPGPAVTDVGDFGRPAFVEEYTGTHDTTFVFQDKSGCIVEVKSTDEFVGAAHAIEAAITPHSVH